MAVCQNHVPLVNIKIAGKWMFIPLINCIYRYWSIAIFVCQSDDSAATAPSFDLDLLLSHMAQLRCPSAQVATFVQMPPQPQFLGEKYWKVRRIHHDSFHICGIKQFLYNSISCQAAGMPCHYAIPWPIKRTRQKECSAHKWNCLKIAYPISSSGFNHHFPMKKLP